ncbi:MAG: Ig-like domain-containing protein [Chloroflexi bacterium]|nr:Ig-like domain-containing protein [Chloroflexota bacterium]
MNHRWISKLLSAITIAMLVMTIVPVTPARADTTAELIPMAPGTYTAWANGVAEVNEGIAAASCGDADRIVTNVVNARESYTVSLASIPDGSTITSIEIRAADRGETNPNGTYATFVRFNGVDSANSATHTATGNSGECTGFPIDTFDVTDTIKDGTTTLQIGVIKINNIALRVGVLSAFVTYTPPTPANDPPVITAPASIAVTEDVASPLTGNSFSDPDAGAASVTVTLSVPSGTLSATSGGGVTATGGGTGTVTLSGSIANINTFIAASNVSFTTALNATATVVLTVDINDEGNTGTGGPQSANTTVDLIVTAVDDPPVAVDDSATLNENDPATLIDVLANDTDVDGGTMQVAAVSAASNGTATNNTTSVSYQPDTGFCGGDSFTYTLNGGSTATVDVTINCTDDPPVAVDDNFTVPGNTTSTLDVLANDTDTDGGPMQIASVGTASNGTPTNNTTDVSYTPNTDYCGLDSFTYTLNGGSSATVDLTVACSPVFTSADNTSFDFGFPGSFNVTAVGNPSTMTITLTGAPAGISLTDNGDGTATLDGDGTTPCRCLSTHPHRQQRRPAQRHPELHPHRPQRPHRHQHQLHPRYRQRQRQREREHPQHPRHHPVHRHLQHRCLRSRRGQRRR